MLGLFNRNIDLKKSIENNLAKEIRRSSKGRIPKAEILELARRTVSRMDFRNSYQMHKSIRGYADILVDNYFAKIKQ